MDISDFSIDDDLISVSFSTTLSDFHSRWQADLKSNEEVGLVEFVLPSGPGVLTPLVLGGAPHLTTEMSAVN